MADTPSVIIKKGLKIVHLNARSVLCKSSETELYVRGFHVILITETWLTTSIPSGSVVRPAYNLGRQDRWPYRHKTRRWSMFLYDLLPILLTKWRVFLSVVYNVPERIFHILLTIFSERESSLYLFSQHLHCANMGTYLNLIFIT